MTANSPFWYNEAVAYYVYNLVYLCRSLLQQENHMKIHILPREGELCSLGNYVLIGQKSEEQQ